MIVTPRAFSSGALSISSYFFACAKPRRMLATVFGEGPLTEILGKARADLLARIRLLLDEELVRFAEVLDAAGPCDDVAAIRLYQAEFSLEAVR